MAKVKFSALISDMRNKLNGSVFSRNRGGAYLRNKVTPSNPKTTAQALARSVLGMLSQAWKGLTELQRSAWRGAVGQWQTTDIFGDIKTPSGNVLFNRVNANIIKAGGTQIDSPAAPTGVSAITNLEVVANIDGSVLTVKQAGFVLGANEVIYIRATPPVSPGIYNAQNQLRHVANLEASIGTAQSIFAGYNEKFGEMVEDQKIFVEARVVNKTTGEESPTFIASVIVIDEP